MLTELEKMMLSSVGMTEEDLQPKDKLTELENKLEALLEYQGLSLKQIDSRQFEVVKKQVGTGDYINPILFEQGMSITLGLWYYLDDKDLPREAIRSGTPTTFDDREYFDWI